MICDKENKKKGNTAHVKGNIVYIPNTGAAMGDLKGRIHPEARFSSMKASSCSCSYRESG
jgi:hypothetical protein